MRLWPFVTVTSALLASSATLQAAEWQSFTTRAGETLKALVYTPTGPGPFPAIVAMHGCGGIGSGKSPISARNIDWGERLQAAGYVVVFPDSFGSRGLGPQCASRNRIIRAKDRADDAMATAAWLGSRADIDASRLGLLGWSNGGTSALHTASVDIKPQGVDFKQVVVFYPGCTALRKAGYQPRLPITIFHGLADDWTAAEDCAALKSVTFIGYAGAYHDFDDPHTPVHTRKAAFSVNRNGIVHRGTDEKARADAIPRAMALFKAM